jgi:hypothetical protein
MKRVKILMICLLVLQASLLTAQNGKSKAPENSLDRVSVASAPEIKALTETWIERFRLANPGTEVNLVTPDKAFTADIQIITGNSQGFSDKSEAWKIVVGRDVIVPVMSLTDPLLDIVSQRGISPEGFAGILSSDGSFTWGKLLDTENSSPVTVIIPDDNAALLLFPGFLN